jgi:4-diphosphocytidyl-2-C-methyl-D-erythritol kinase
MLFFPNAKVNLGLYVTEKRNDGFHNIESIFVPIKLCDVLDIIHSSDDQFELKVLGITIDGDAENNICTKAWKLMHEQHGIGGVKCELLKNIPTGAGLGGGSSDGAFMLVALNQLFNLNLSNQQLKEYSATLGSDCPFFIENKPKFVFGRGEFLEDVELDLKSYFISVVHPGVHVSTPKAYSLIQPTAADINLRQISSMSIDTWRNTLTNQFEAPIAQLHPEIGAIKEKLYDAGAIFAAMSGSGSAVIGIFSEQQNLTHLFPNYFCQTVEFL